MNWLCQDTAGCRNAHPSAYCRTPSYFQVPPTLILTVVHFCPVRCTAAQEDTELKFFFFLISNKVYENTQES